MKNGYEFINISRRLDSVSRSLFIFLAIAFACFAQAGTEDKEYAYLGVYVESISELLGEHLGIERGVGVVVEGVIEGGPADAAGILKNDILLKYDDQILIGTKQTVTLVKISEPGSEHLIHLIRKGEKMDIPVVVGSKKTTKEPKKQGEQSRMFPVSPIAPGLPRGERAHAIDALRSSEPGEHRLVFIDQAKTEDLEQRMELNEEVEAMVQRVQSVTQGMEGIAAPTIVFQGQDRVFEFSDGSGASYTIVDKDGKRTLSIVDSKGDEVFNGIMTEEGMAMLPEKVREELPRFEEIVSVRSIAPRVWVPEAQRKESF